MKFQETIYTFTSVGFLTALALNIAGALPNTAYLSLASFVATYFSINKMWDYIIK